MNKSTEQSPRVLPQTPSPKVARFLQDVHDNNRRRLEQTMSSELDRIRGSVTKELARKRMIEKLEEEDLNRRNEIIRKVQSRLEKTDKLRQEKLKLRKETLKFLHSRHKEKMQAKAQIDKEQAKHQRQLSEAAKAQVQRCLKERDDLRHRSFKNISQSKAFYQEAVKQQNSLYQSSVGFAEKARREIHEKLQKAMKNYKQAIHEKIKPLEEHNHSKVPSTYATSLGMIEKKHNKLVHDLIFSLKKSGLILDNNQKKHNEKLEFNHATHKMAEERRLELKEALKLEALQKKVDCKMRHPQSADQKADPDKLPMDRRSRLEASHRKSAGTLSTARDTHRTNFWTLVEKHKQTLSRNTHAKNDELVEEQNDLQRTLHKRAHILNRSQSVQRSALFNKDRINPESIILF